MSRRHPFAPLSALMTAAMLLMTSGPGCSAMQKFIPGNQPDSTLPPQELIVGGGFQINYTARRNGTAILADRNRGQILVTESMAAGDTYQFDFDPHAPENAGLFGTGDDNKLSEARPTLYFLPEGYQMPAANAAPAPNPNASAYQSPPRAYAPTPIEPTPAASAPASTKGSGSAPARNPYDDAPAIN